MDVSLQAPPAEPSYPTEHLLYGDDPLRGIVAVERLGLNGVRLYRREDGALASEEAPLRPWLLAERREPWGALRGAQAAEPLAGDHPLRYLIEFADWPSFLDGVRAAEEAGARFHRLRSPIEQYLVRSGRTLFKGMVFADVRRLQVDIETTGFDPRDPESQVIVVALKFGDALEEVLAQDEQSG
jgi:DNA polymerase I